MITLTELQQLLKREDEVSLLEILNINSEDIVERFIDVIENKYEELIREYGEEDDQEENVS